MRSSFTVWVLALSAVAADAAAGAASAAAPAAPDLVIEAEDAADPFSREDGSGYANEVVHAAFRAVGIPVRLQVVPYARCKLNVLAGRVAGCLSMSWDPSFAGKVAFSERPLFSVHALLVDDATRPLAARRPADIASGSVLGVVNGYEYPPAVATLARHGVVLEATASDEINLRKLAAHRLDAAILMVSTKVWATPDPHTLKGGHHYRPVMLLGTLGSYIGFSTTHPGGRLARERFDEGMRRIAADGTLEAIDRRWESTLAARGAPDRRTGRAASAPR